LNVYLPLAGSDENSSLPIIPKSHLEKESEYIISDSPCYVNGKKYTVPCIVHRNKGLDMITPNPNEGEIMIFTPNLIHGGGVNNNPNSTRVSLEMRFFA
jgi:ectoine hydroxylase-related dioxygenase (phytanoyl-CoA dioxygenase family)